MNENGKLYASTATLGSACHPVYLSNGSLTQCRSSGDLLTFKQEKGSPTVILDAITDEEIEEDTHIGYTDKPCYWYMTPHVGVDGVMEVGKYIDFHETPHDNNSKYSDYSTRIVALAPTTKNDVSLPTAAG
jgi:hypothetical protein